MNSLDFYLRLEDKLRQLKDLYNIKKLKLNYHATAQMERTTPNYLILYEKYEIKGEIKVVLPLSMVTEFWIAAVNTFGALYEVELKILYSRIDKAKLTQQDTQQCLESFYEISSGTIPFTTTSLFEEGDVGTRVFCREVERTMNRRSSLYNWKQSWIPLLSKNYSNDAETKISTLGTILASTPPDIH